MKFGCSEDATHCKYIQHRREEAINIWLLANANQVTQSTHARIISL